MKLAPLLTSVYAVNIAIGIGGFGHHLLHLILVLEEPIPTLTEQWDRRQQNVVNDKTILLEATVALGKSEAKVGFGVNRVTTFPRFSSVCLLLTHKIQVLPERIQHNPPNTQLYISPVTHSITRKWCMRVLYHPQLFSWSLCSTQERERSISSR